MTKKPVLGRGLGALMSDAGTVTPTRNEPIVPLQETAKQEEGVIEIKLSNIEINRSQPRTHFDENTLTELSESIKVFGLIQPVTVRETKPGRYQIISGERRYRAAKKAGLTTIPVYVRKADDKEILEMALVENIQREDLDAIEVAISFQRLIDECSLTQESLSERVGKKRATVANYLRLLRLPAKVQLLIRERKLSMGHARAIVGLDDEKLQQKIAQKTIDEELSVRQVEALIKNSLIPVSKKQASTITEEELPDDYFRLIELLGPYFNNNINVKRSDKGDGRITIHFANDEEVRNFMQKLNEITQT
ncbi:MAG: ParB/RepB/Spo0J family partition protein [Bacteroidales bacterium]|nr:ParB/RepB/Spo0J family partition protein [Bacteroidales bacterium]MCL2132949.1 ParB/RepB/Spo0J family partition protein [Bacteroidales bacterium]